MVKLAYNKLLNGRTHTIFECNQSVSLNFLEERTPDRYNKYLASTASAVIEEIFSKVIIITTPKLAIEHKELKLFSSLAVSSRC